MWLALKRPPLEKTKSYPYQALDPVTHTNVVINGKEDIYRILISCHDEAIEKGFKVGEALYNQLFFISEAGELYSEKCQTLIKKYIFCETFNCPPFPSLAETPAEMIDDFMLIKREISEASTEQ